MRIEKPQEFLIEDIIRQEHFMLLDSGTNINDRHYVSSDWYSSTVYNTNTFAQIDGNLIVHDKLIWLNENKYSLNRYYRKKRLRIAKINQRENGGGNREILENVCHAFFKIWHAARESEYIPDDKKEFERLYEITREAAEDSNAKINYALRYGNFLSKPEDLHADEQLIAASLYRSLIERHGSTILTADSDLPRILDSTVCTLERMTLGYNLEYKLERLAAYPIKIYFMLQPGVAELKIDTGVAKSQAY